MSERKVINKYFPPDFDPAKIPRRKLKDKNNQQVVRLMAPFSMRCNSCGEYIYKGKKFNARKETVEGEDYFGIRIFRFYIKCTLCSTEITFKTDPKNADYLAEHGASRNFESWRDDKAEQDAKAYMPNAGEDDEEDGEDGEGKKRREEAEDAMKALETSTENSKREMDILDALQDIRNRNARNERISTTANPSSILSSGAAGPSKPPALTPEEMLLKQQEEEDEELVRAVFSKIPLPPSVGGATVAAANGKGKGREVLAEGGLGGDYGSDSEGEGEGGEEGDDPSSFSSSSAMPPPPLPPTAPASLSIKRKTLAGGPGDAGGEDEPTLARLLGDKGVSVGAGSGGFGFGKAAAPKKKAKIGLPGLKKK